MKSLKVYSCPHYHYKMIKMVAVPLFSDNVKCESQLTHALNLTCPVRDRVRSINSHI